MTGIPTSTEQDKFITGFPFYYGWIIMAVGTLGMIMTSPGQTYAESIFIEYILEDLNLSRALISTLYSFGTLVGGFSLPFWGRKIDQHGTRKMVTLVSILFGIACIYMGFIQNALMVGLGFILVRMLGQGSLGLISQTAINHWWVRKRGMVMGISGLLMALLGVGTFPSLVYWLISIFQWRWTFIILGLSLVVFMAPVGFLFFRGHPEDYQLNPDGMVNPDPEASWEVFDDPLAEENWSLKEALRTRPFWIFGVSLSLFSLLVTGVMFHLVSIFQSQGLDVATAASVFIPIAITGAIVSMGAGYLSDHLPLKYLLALGLLLQAISLLMVVWMADKAAAYIFGMLLGSANGFARAVAVVIWPNFYGREHLGSIYGFTTAMSIIGAALGPIVFGYAFDFLGSYHPALIISTGLCLLLIPLLLTTNKPQKTSHRSMCF